MVRGINKLYGWPIEKEWLLNYSKSHGVDFGVAKGLTTAAAVDNLEQESGVKSLIALHSQKDKEKPILILTLYVDSDCWYDVDAECLVTPQNSEECIQKLLKIIGKPGEKPQWWPYISRSCP